MNNTVCMLSRIQVRNKRASLVLHIHSFCQLAEVPTLSLAFKTHIGRMRRVTKVTAYKPFKLLNRWGHFINLWLVICIETSDDIIEKSCVKFNLITRELSGIF